MQIKTAHGFTFVAFGGEKERKGKEHPLRGDGVQFG